MSLVLIIRSKNSNKPRLTGQFWHETLSITSYTFHPLKNTYFTLLAYEEPHL